MRERLLLIVIMLLALGVLLWAPWWGVHDIGFNEILQPQEDNTQAMVFWRMRVPRVLTAFIAGAALALSGMTFQAMFRNPLATPFTLGVASGGSLGAVVAIRLGLAFTFLGLSATAISAFLGAMLSIGMVYGLTRLKGDYGTFRLLLAGVAINAFFSSLIMFINYTAHYYDAFRLMRWLMGGLNLADYQAAAQMTPFFLVGSLILFYHLHHLDLLNTGEDLAQSRGVDIRRTRAILFITISLMVGSVVSVCGPIGFVGLIVPHCCRLALGHRHRSLMPVVMLSGGAFLAVCDAAARTLAPPAEIPVGVITALLGGPFFLWLLLTTAGDRGRM